MALRVVQFHLSHVMQAMRRQGGQVDSATLLAILQGAENTLHWAASSGVAMDPPALSDCSNRVRSLSQSTLMREAMADSHWLSCIALAACKVTVAQRTAGVQRE